MTSQPDIDALQEAVDALEEAGFELQVDQLHSNEEYMAGGTVEYTTVIRGDIIFTQAVQQDEL